jgi:hypothetical protein
MDTDSSVVVTTLWQQIRWNGKVPAAGGHKVKIVRPVSWSSAGGISHAYRDLPIDRETFHVRSLFHI